MTRIQNKILPELIKGFHTLKKFKKYILQVQRFGCDDCKQKEYCCRHRIMLEV